ncbi:MAG: fused MFS/spermidine synthase, partial [Myxococcales bacterium]
LDTLGLAGGGPLAVRLVLPFLLVLPPTFLMGGTLPVLTRFLTRSVDGIGRSFGTLYALNTLGAAFGCGLAGFVLLGELGVLRTGALAAAVNVLVGLGAWLLFRFSARAGAAPAPAPEAEAAAPQVASTTPAARRLLTWAFAFCGFTSIGYEVLWFRVLSTTVESSSYAFTLLLTTFLFGLALGGLLHARRLSKSNQLELFVAIESALALAALVSVALLGHARPLSRLLLWQFGEHGPGSYLAILILSAAVILVPVLLIGVLFPAVVTLTTQRLATLGRDVGLLYSVNTLGGIAGSLAVGFLGIPLLGTQRSFFLLSAMNLAIAFAVLGLDAAGAPRKRRSIAAAGVAVAAVALLLPSDYLLRDFTAYDDSRVLWAKEGRDGTLAVLEYDRETVCNSRLYECDEKCLPEFSERQLIFGSVSYANTILPGKRYMSVLAHLPMLTHRDPRRVLEVCFGTGITASTFTLYPELESLTVVDINPDVFLAAPWFSRDNRDVVTHPKVKLVADDGRHYLTAHRAQYDVISFEPPPPRSPGISSLYSREFYQVIRERLAPGGVLTQWIPLQDSSDLLDKSLIQSLLEVFPHVSLWIPARYEAVLLASLEPLPLDLAQWRLRAEGAPVLQSLEGSGYPGAKAPLSSFMMGTDALP